MAAETNLQTTTSLSPAVAAQYIKDTLLVRSKRDTIFWDIAEKTPLPRNSGKTCQFNRFERLALPETPLEEGVTPAATSMNISSVQAVLDEWGAYVKFANVVEWTIKHPLMSEVNSLLSDQHTETLDREVQVACMGSSAVYFAGNKTARNLLVAADTLKSDDVRRVVATLRQNGARDFGSGRLRGVVDPFVEGDLNKDGTFVQASSYSQVETLRRFFIGRWMSVDWERSNLIPILSLIAGADVTEAQLTGGAIPAGTTGFAGTTTVRTVVTRLDASTRFETGIDAEASHTNAAAFAAQVTIAAAAATGTYNVYCTLQDGAAGTATRQVRVRHTTGTASIVIFVRSGTPSASNVFVVNGTGAVAPPAPPAGINVHLSYIFGRQSIGATTLEGMETFMTEGGKATDSDPLAQRRSSGWRQLFKALVLNPDNFRRVESASEFN